MNKWFLDFLQTVRFYLHFDIRRFFMIFRKFWKKSTHKFQSVVKTLKAMFLTQKPKFHRSGDLKNISQKIISRKNDFPRNFGFPSAMSHTRTSTKMGFPENQPKMVQLHGPITFSKMVVRGWYMPHFDRRDLLNSKKQVWGGFRNLPGLYGPICEILRFFRKFRSGPRLLKKWFFWLQSPKKWSKITFFSNFFDFSKNMELQLQNGIFTSAILPIDQKRQVFEI